MSIEPEWEISPTEINVEIKVGTGITSEVFKGSFQGRIVAVKQINFNKARLNTAEQQAFVREVDILPRLCHPNLVEFVGVITVAEPFRIITEYCEGGCLFEILHNLDEVHLEWSQQIKMIRDTAEAMHYLHTFSPMIIHRDLKSLNLLLLTEIKSNQDEPLVKVSDFGLSRMKDQAPDSEWGKMTIAAGTCHWMAPEVVAGETYDEKVDVYSFGMIMFEVICREVPFEEEDPQQVVSMVGMGQRPDPEAIPPDCPPPLRKIMEECWAQDPKTRPSFDVVLPTINAVTLS